MTSHPWMPTTPMTALPTAAPSTFARPATAAASPSAMPRFSAGNVVAIAALATGIMPPAPAACTTRPASKSPKPPHDFARPHSSDPAANTARHAVNTRLRPRRSASLPTTGMRAA